MRVGPNWYLIRNETTNTTKVSKFYVEKGLKVSTLACKCVFYRPEHNAKGLPHRIEF